MEATVTTVVGLLGGVLMSFLFWYWLTHYVAPQIGFADGVSRIVAADQDRHIYRIQLRNSSRRRGIIDVSLAAHMVYPDPSPELSQSWAPGNLISVPIPLRSDHVFRIGPRNTRTIVFAVGPPTPEVARHHSPLVVSAMSDPSGQGFEKLLGLSEKAYVRVRVLCFDEWSGSRKFYESPRYTLKNVFDGRFGGTVIQK